MNLLAFSFWPVLKCKPLPEDKPSGKKGDIFSDLVHGESVSIQA